MATKEARLAETILSAEAGSQREKFFNSFFNEDYGFAKSTIIILPARNTAAPINPILEIVGTTSFVIFAE